MGYHAVNLLLHLLAIVLLWDSLRRMVSSPAAIIATAIFAVHPFQAEPVNYVFARSTLLATVLCLSALSSWTRGHRWWALLWFGLALAAKEECVAFPAFLLLWNLATSRDRKELKPIAAMFALSLAAGVRVLLATGSTPGSGAGVQAGISATSYALAQGLVILRYLRMLLLPWGFTVDPDTPVPPVWLGAVAWLAVLALVGLSTLRFSRARAGFWFISGLILLLPSSSILPAMDLAADRRMYLPLIAFAVCAGLLLERLRPVFLVPPLALLVILSFQRTEIWQTERALWGDAVEKAPRKVRARIQLARVEEPPRAIELLEETKPLAPEDARIPAEEGRIYLASGKPEKALLEFGRALALEPNSSEAVNNRGAALLALDQRNVAQQDFERALTLDPCQFDARLNLLRMGLSKPLPAACKYSSAQREALQAK